MYLRPTYVLTNVQGIKGSVFKIRLFPPYLFISSFSRLVASQHYYVATQHYYVATQHYYIASQHYYVALLRSNATQIRSNATQLRSNATRLRGERMSYQCILLSQNAAFLKGQKKTVCQQNEWRHENISFLSLTAKSYCFRRQSLSA